MKNVYLNKIKCWKTECFLPKIKTINRISTLTISISILLMVLASVIRQEKERKWHDLELLLLTDVMFVYIKNQEESIKYH